MAMIPTVTPTDLEAFHRRHFASYGQPHTTCLKFDSQQDYQPRHYELGHYADKSRRTLTDEQIAIFRHTEIQNLLKQKRQAEEVTMDNQSSRTKERETIPFISGEEQIRTKDEAPSFASQQISAPRKRRKRDNQQAQSQDSRPWTHRRSARELDQFRGTDIELDY